MFNQVLFFWLEKMNVFAYSGFKYVMSQSLSHSFEQLGANHYVGLHCYSGGLLLKFRARLFKTNDIVS